MVVAETMGFGVVVRGQAKEVVGCGQGGICSGSWGLWVVVVARPRLFCSCHGACVLFLGHSGCCDGGFAALFLVGLVVVPHIVGGGVVKRERERERERETERQ